MPSLLTYHMVYLLIEYVKHSVCCFALPIEHTKYLRSIAISRHIVHTK